MSLSFPSKPPAFWNDETAHLRSIVDYLKAVADRGIKRFYNSTTRPTASLENKGKIIFYTTTKKMQYSDGTSWIDL